MEYLSKLKNQSYLTVSEFKAIQDYVLKLIKGTSLNTAENREDIKYNASEEDLRNILETLGELED